MMLPMTLVSKRVDYKFFDAFYMTTPASHWRCMQCEAIKANVVILCHRCVQTTTCYTTPCFTYKWHRGAWSECSVSSTSSCGIGSQFRTVRCLRNDGIQVLDMYCLTDHTGKHRVYLVTILSLNVSIITWDIQWRFFVLKLWAATGLEAESLHYIALLNISTIVNCGPRFWYKVLYKEARGRFINLTESVCASVLAA